MTLQIVEFWPRLQRQSFDALRLASGQGVLHVVLARRA
jgi:hypothetical protein